MTQAMTNSFLALLRAGLWEKEVAVTLSSEEWAQLFRMAQEQAVVGLLAVGMEHTPDVPAAARIPFVNYVLKLEAKNREMNEFIQKLFIELSAAGVQARLVKGQGVAQCYTRPLWRACGDVDLLLDAENYAKARALLEPRASHVEPEEPTRKHLGLFFGEFEVELHGTLRAGLWRSYERTLDAVTAVGGTRIWQNGAVAVPLPDADSDVFLVFSHILQHFYQGGIGLRQICDWCRLLYTFHGSLDVALLSERLRQAGILSEWKAFAALAVDHLGLPVEAVPLYDASARWRRKGLKVLGVVLSAGNFGRSRSSGYAWRLRLPVILRKLVSFWMHNLDTLRVLPIFPLNAIRAWGCMFRTGLRHLRG